MENLSKEPTSKDPKFKRYSVDFINIYEITDSDLTIIERGSKNDIFLNFSIFLISIATSFIIALYTCDFKLIPITQIIFIVICVFGFGIGIICFVLWYKSKDDVKEIILKIKNQLPNSE